ncbi:MAG: TonB-dependent receptor, partial [bacterium]|nr:TonB-dependent receptor [bacterium]
SSANLYLSDRIQLRPGLQLDVGLRYSLTTRPTEVNQLDRIPYDCDCNNFAPRLALAWQAPGGWTARGSFAISFAEIQPVTYQQTRNNLPLVRNVQLQNPDFLDPTGDIDFDDPSGRAVPTFLTPELVSPYVHQYNFSLERGFARDTHLRLAYIGSRSVKIFNNFTMNRGEPTPGIPLLLKTVDARRPDSRFYDVFHIVNGGLGFFNAAQVTVDTRPVSGLTTSITYTFSKAIDEGPDHTATAANKDLTGRRHQWQYESFRDRRGLSAFDTPHS